MTKKNTQKQSEKPEGYTFGRPTGYDPKYIQQMIDFFSTPYFKEVTKVVVKKGVPISIQVEVPNDFPLFEKFSVEIGFHRETLINWCKVHADFFDAYKKCKELQKARLIQLTLSGYYNPTFSIFTAKNITDMNDTVITKHEGTDFDDFDFDQLSKDELNDLRELLAKATPKQELS